MTGKGSLAKLIGHNSFGSRLLSTLGFAPNLLASRFETAFHFNPLISPILAPTGLNQELFSKIITPLYNSCYFGVGIINDIWAEDEDKQPLDVINPLSKDFLRVRIKTTTSLGRFKRYVGNAKTDVLFRPVSLWLHIILQVTKANFNKKLNCLRKRNQYLSFFSVRAWKVSTCLKFGLIWYPGKWLFRSSDKLEWRADILGDYFKIYSTYLSKCLGFFNLWRKLLNVKKPQTFENAKAKQADLV